MSDRMARVVVGVLGFRVTGLLRFMATAVLLAGLGWVGLEHWKASELAAERQTLEARAFDLVRQGMSPGSALACLDVVASNAFQESCEKALFASPESTAAAVSYVAAQLSLLAAGKSYLQHTGDREYGASLVQLRRNAEWDAFGIVAHVLAARDGCTAAECRALTVLSRPQRVRANLAQRAFEANVTRYAALWADGGRTAVARHHEPAAAPETAVSPTATASVAPVKPAPPPRTPNNYFFPSADSIPAVSIMAPEPESKPEPKPDSKPDSKPESKAAAAETTRKPPSRKSAGVPPSPASSAGTRTSSAPMPLAAPVR